MVTTMSDDSPKQKAYSITRARAQLIGAIVVCVLLLIILPNILSNRPSPLVSNLLQTHSAARIPPAVKVILPNTDNQGKKNGIDVGPSDRHDIPHEPVTSSAVTNPAEVIKPENSPPSHVGVETAPVENTPIVNPSATPVTTSQQYSIQVGVFNSAENMHQLKAQLQAKGFSSFEVETKGKSRLCVGKFKSSSDAAMTLMKLKQAGLNGFIIPL